MCSAQVWLPKNRQKSSTKTLELFLRRFKKLSRVPISSSHTTKLSENPSITINGRLVIRFSLMETNSISKCSLKGSYGICYQVSSFCRGNDFLKPLIIDEQSKVTGLEQAKKIIELVNKGENVVMLSNHQTEADPQVVWSARY